VLGGERMVLGKRKFKNGSSGRPFKRRKFFRRFRNNRRRGFGRSRASSYTTRSLTASNAFRFRGKKLSKTAWRRHLIKDTLTEAHYRSIQTRLTTVLTPPAITDCQSTVISALDSGNPFWKRNPAINQGLQVPEIIGGVFTVPTWGVIGQDHPETIVIRGGRYWITANCQVNNDPCNVRVQLVFAKQQGFAAGGAAGNTLTAWLTLINAQNPKPLSWTYQQQPDYDQYFYPPVLDKVVRLLPGEDMTIVKAIKPMKLDCASFLLEGGWFPYWFVYASQSATNVAGDPVVGFTTGTNLSFAVTSILDDIV